MRKDKGYKEIIFNRMFPQSSYIICNLYKIWVESDIANGLGDYNILFPPASGHH